jgi:predicted porin
MKALRKLLTAALATALPLAALAQPAPTEQPPVSENRPTPAAETPPPVAPAPKPAAAPAPLVTVYGTLNVNLQYTEASDATSGSAADVSPRTAVSIDSSNIGVRGALDIAHGMKAVYQCETQASIDGLDTRAICNRNSRIGLSGTFGTLFLGNWDTPYKALAYGTKADDPFGNTDVFGFQGLFGSPGYGVRSTAFSGAANAGFDQRAANSVAYWSPKFSGLSFKLQYSTNEQRSADGIVDPQLVAAGVNFDLGGLSLGAAAEYHEDAYGLRTITGANASRNASKDMAWKLAAGYELPLGVGALTVMGMVEQLLYEQENAGDGFSDYDRLAWLVGAKFRTGAHEFRARYSQALDPNADAATGTTLAANAEDELGAQHYALGYAYHATKSTQLFAFFTQILNDDAARYTFGVGGATAVLATPAGADPMAFGVGIRQAF